jgi:hypothetical protein
MVERNLFTRLDMLDLSFLIVIQRNPGLMRDSLWLPAEGIDMKLVMDEYNVWFDRYERAFKKEGFSEQYRAFLAMEGQIESKEREITGTMMTWSGRLGFLLKSPRGRREWSSKSFAWFALYHRRPWFRHHAKAETRINLLIIALALAAWKAEHGSYPERLAEIMPVYLKELPLDHFSGKPPVYQRKGEGYILYSIGQNLKDDGGRAGMDIVITIEG